MSVADWVICAGCFGAGCETCGRAGWVYVRDREAEYIHHSQRATQVAAYAQRVVDVVQGFRDSRGTTQAIRGALSPTDAALFNNALVYALTAGKLVAEGNEYRRPTPNDALARRSAFDS